MYDLIYEQIIKLNTIYNHTFCVGGGKRSCFKLNELTKYCEIVTKNKVKINKIKKNFNL